MFLELNKDRNFENSKNALKLFTIIEWNVFDSKILIYVDEFYTKKKKKVLYVATPTRGMIWILNNKMYLNIKYRYIFCQTCYNDMFLTKLSNIFHEQMILTALD